VYIDIIRGMLKESIKIIKEAVVVSGTQGVSSSHWACPLHSGCVLVTVGVSSSQ